MPASPTAHAERLAIGADKVAALCLMLPEGQLGRVMGLLEEDEIRTIAAAMARLGPVGQSHAEELRAAFLAELRHGPALVGSPRAVERVLRGSLLGQDQLVDTILADIGAPPPDSTWERLGALEPQELADYLTREHPQVAAVVLSKLFPEYAARVLALLPEDLAGSVLQRLVALETVDQGALRDVERTLFRDLIGHGQRRRADPHAQVAGLVELADAATQNRLLAALEVLAPESAATVRKLILTFPDLARLGDASLRTLIQECDAARLGVALRLADGGTREAFFRNMSQRQAKMLREELELASPMRMSEIEAAQQEIVLLAKALSAAGQISLELEPAAPAMAS
jgi:flagellar motor switch protein FliG